MPTARPRAERTAGIALGHRRPPLDKDKLSIGALVLSLNPFDARAVFRELSRRFGEQSITRRMKKNVLILAAIFAVGFLPAPAADDKKVDVSKLPPASTHWSSVRTGVTSPSGTVAISRFGT